MPREPEDHPVDVVPISLVGSEAFHFRLVNFPTGKSQPLDSHINKLNEITNTIGQPGVTVIITGHSSARNRSGDASLNQRLSDQRCGAIRDAILRKAPGAAIQFHGEGDTAGKNELKRGIVSANSGFHRAVSVKVVRGKVPPPPVPPKESTQFLIGIATKIQITGLGMPVLPGGAAKQASAKLLEKVSPQMRKLLKDVAKKLGKEMKDEFDIPVGLGVAGVKVAGDILIRDPRKKEARSKFDTFAVAMTEGEVFVDTTLSNGGFTPFSADDTNDASTFTAGGALLDFVIARTDNRNLDVVHITNVVPKVNTRMNPPLLRIPFKVDSGTVPIFVGVSDAKISPA